MDVQAVAAGATPQPQEAATPAAPPVLGGGSAISSGAPQSSVPQPSVPHGDAGPLSPVVAKILAHGDVPKPVSVNVSYRVEHDPNMIVTVFTDPNTGAEIAQVPAEVMVQIAQFFDKQSGVTLDRSV
jgi:hypothetical protein